jgi:hypothetical protein
MDPLVAKALGFTFPGIDFEATGIMILGAMGEEGVCLINYCQFCFIISYALLNHYSCFQKPKRGGEP